jgi:hypothetical protein
MDDAPLLITLNIDSVKNLALRIHHSDDQIAARSGRVDIQLYITSAVRASGPVALF